MEYIFFGNNQFSIYIENNLAEENANISLWTGLGGTDIPVYRDYVVRIKEEVERMHGTLISLDPEYGSDAILNGIEVFKLSNRDGNLAKPNSVLPAFHPPKFRTTKRIFIAIGIGTGIFALFSLIACVVFGKRRKTKRYASNYPLSSCWCWFRLNSYKREQTGKMTSSMRKGQFHHFSLAEIKIATNNFHEDLIIGVGGFGQVYKGQIDDEETMTMAIKRLNPKS